MKEAPEVVNRIENFGKFSNSVANQTCKGDFTEKRGNNMSNTSLGDRMKGYEGITRHQLMRRTPVIIRIDGKGFHSFTKGFHKPFDEILTNAMHQTMLGAVQKC